MAEAGADNATEDRPIDKSMVPSSTPSIMPGVNIEQLTKAALTGPPDIDVGKITGQLADIKQREMAAHRNAQAGYIGQMGKDAARVRQAFEAESHDADQLRPWNTEAEQAKHSSSPIEQFGSFATAFAMLASAFTRTPMANALNGAAAAMKARQANDDKEYERAFEAWKANTDLAIKRHNIMHSVYEDATKLMEVNAQVGRAKIQAAAARFGDEKTLLLLRAGYDPDIFKLIQDRQRTAVGMLEAMPKIQQMYLNDRILAIDPDWNSNDPRRKQYALQRLHQGKLTPEQQLFDEGVAELERSGQNTSENRLKLWSDIKRSGVAGQILKQEMSDATKKEIAYANMAIRKNIADAKERGVELTLETKRWIAAQNNDVRREIAEDIIAGRERVQGMRDDSALQRLGIVEDRKDARQAARDAAAMSREEYKAAARKDLQGVKDEDRLTLQKYIEQGRNQRSEDTIKSRETLARMSDATKRWVEDERESAAMDRLVANGDIRKDLQERSLEAKQAITEYIEGGRAERFQQALTQREDLANLGWKERQHIEEMRQKYMSDRAAQTQASIDARAKEGRDAAMQRASASLSQRAEEFEKKFGQKEEQFQQSEARKEQYQREAQIERERHNREMADLAKSRGDDIAAYHEAMKRHNLAMEELSAKHGLGKIDQAILNEIDAYPGLDKNSIAFMQPQSQRKLMASFESARQIEHIAKYATDNPESVGLLADALRHMNWDAFQGLTKDPNAWSAAVTAGIDKATDESAKRKGLTETQAAKAKVMGKLLTTQAFTDAAQFGAQGGGTVYLDRAFREIYQQASNLPTFLDLLRERQIEANRKAEAYHMGLDRRTDVDSEFPFWRKGVEGILGDVGKTGPSVGYIREGKDGKRYRFKGGNPADRSSWELQ